MPDDLAKVESTTEADLDSEEILHVASHVIYQGEDLILDRWISCDLFGSLPRERLVAGPRSGAGGST